MTGSIVSNVPEKPKRESGLELYRIILMLAIIAHHYFVNSGLMEKVSSGDPTGNSLFLILFGAWGKTGINCFLLITGYFMCKSQITLAKFMKLFLEVEFYKFVFAVIFFASGYTPFSVKAFIRAILPITSISDGFVSCFLVFYLLIPFLNILIRNMDRRKHLLLLGLLFFVYTLLPSSFFYVSFNYVTWFSVLYFLSAYIRLYPAFGFSNARLWGIVSIAILLFSSLTIVGIYLIKGSNYYFFVADSNKILAVATSVSLFLFFKNMRIEYSRFINATAGSVFGVLLIHANSDAMRQWLWRDILHNPAMLESGWLVFHAIGSVLGIFAVCTVIDQCRIHFLETPFFKFWNAERKKHVIAWGRQMIRLKEQ